MTDKPSVNDVPVAELSALFAIGRKEISPEQVLKIQQFIRDVGGIENACAAIDELSDLRRAA